MLPIAEEERGCEGHVVQLASDTASIASSAAKFLAEGLAGGNALLLIATQRNQGAILHRLRLEGVDLTGLLNDGRLSLLNAERTLASIMKGRLPDAECFSRVVGGVTRKLHADPRNTGVRAYGEMVSVLWSRRQYTAAIALEQLWNRLLKALPCRLFCSYPIDILSDDLPASVGSVLLAHGQVVSGADEVHLNSAIDRAMDEILGPHVQHVRDTIERQYQPAWAGVQGPAATIVWLRDCMPSYVGAILTRARYHYAACTST